jgi:hypothetical protein
MKLFYGGYGKYKFYTVAKTEAEAIKNIKEKHNLQALPVTVEVIDDIDGFEIKAVAKKVTK